MSVGAVTGMIAVDPKKGDRANLHRPLMTFIMGAFPEQQEVSSITTRSITTLPYMHILLTNMLLKFRFPFLHTEVPEIVYFTVIPISN